MNRAVTRLLRALPLALAGFSPLALSACAAVAPYERERLARPDMAFAESGEVKAGEEHAQAYREASSGGGAAKGGGCGCN